MVLTATSVTIACVLWPPPTCRTKKNHKILKNVTTSGRHERVLKILPFYNCIYDRLGKPKTILCFVSVQHINHFCS